MKFKIVLIATKMVHLDEESIIQSYQTDNIDRALAIDLEGFTDEPDMFLSIADSIEFFGKVVNDGN